MATIRQFEDLEVWKKSRVLSQEIFNIISVGDLSKDYKLRDQMNGSSGSVMDNIAEGFERGGKAEFINFLSFSKGSAGELKSQLYRALDRKYISAQRFNELYAMATEIGKMLNGLMEYLNQSQVKGTKFKNRVKV